MKNKSTIIDEAKHLTETSRKEEYGDAEVVYDLVGELWSRYQYARTDVLLSAKDVCFMMVILKVVREIFRDKRDNLVDIVGYINLIDRLNLDN